MTASFTPRPFHHPSDTPGSFCLRLCRSTDPVTQANKSQGPPRSAYDYLKLALVVLEHESMGVTGNSWPAVRGDCAGPHMVPSNLLFAQGSMRRQRRPWRLVRTTPIKGIPRSSRKVPCAGGGYRPLIRLGLKRAAVLFSARSMS